MNEMAIKELQVNELQVKARASKAAAWAKSKVGAAVALATVGAMSAPAHAVIDVAGVVTEIDGTVGPIGLIGAAVLLVVVAVAAFKWVRRAIS
jgi:protein-S-isoprenylcysteine O-methyltransferase Ste14